MQIESTRIIKQIMVLGGVCEARELSQLEKVIFAKLNIYYN